MVRPNSQSEDADQNAPEEQFVAVDAAEEMHGGEIGQLQIGFAAGFAGFGG